MSPRERDDERYGRGWAKGGWLVMSGERADNGALLDYTDLFGPAERCKSPLKTSNCRFWTLRGPRQPTVIPVDTGSRLDVHTGDRNEVPRREEGSDDASRRTSCSWRRDGDLCFGLLESFTRAGERGTSRLSSRVINANSLR